MTNTQTIFARVTLEYDKALERAPLEAITKAIIETSRMPISADHLVRQIEQQSNAAHGDDESAAGRFLKTRPNQMNSEWRV